MKKLFIILLLLLCSCSTTVVNVHKTVIIWGDENKVQVTGSDLKDNEMKQTTTFDMVLDYFFP